jgi:hypothetical protein
MIALFIVSALIGAVISGLTGIGFLLWLAGGFIFICGLPFALISSFVHGEVSYAQDREDYRQALAEIKAEERACEHEFAEDARIDRLIESSKTQTSIYNDNRQVHFHGTPKESICDKKGAY